MELNQELLPEDPTGKIDQMDDRIFFSMFEKAGTWGDYQKITSIIWCIIGYLCGGLMLIVPFLFYQDPYHCVEIYQDQTCLQHVCSLPLSDRIPFLPTASMQTLGNQYGDYRCPQQKLVIDGFMTLAYIGGLIGNLFLAIIGDFFGRKSLLQISLSAIGIGLFLTISSGSLGVAGMGLFLALAGAQSSFSICFYFIAQTVSQQYRSKLSVLFQTFCGVGVLLNPFYWYFISKWESILAIFYIIPLVVALGISIFIVRDTPICLILRNQPDIAFKDLQFIAKMNKSTNFDLTVKILSQVKQNYTKSVNLNHSKKQHYNLTDLFKFQSLKWMTLYLIFLQLIIAFQFYAPALMLDQFKLNIFVDGLVLGSSEFLSYPVCFYIITKHRRSDIAYGCFITTALCAIILFFTWNEGDEAPNMRESIQVLVLIFIFRFSISVEFTCFCVYFNELYPTQIRVIGTSFIALMGELMVTIAPQIIDFTLRIGLPIMIIFAIFSILSIYVQSKLPQTFQIRPPDVILEVVNRASTHFVKNLEKFTELKEMLIKNRPQSMYQLRDLSKIKKLRL